MTTLARPKRPRMTSDEFIAWVMEGPDAGRCELVDGEVVAMAPERLAHARVKARVLRALEDAIAGRALPCEALPDGVSVEIDAATVYEPDALLRCGEPLDGETAKVVDPVVVVEVRSPSTAGRDAGVKLGDYFRIPSVRHYLILDTRRRTVVHHARGAEPGKIETRVLRDGVLRLDPPSIELDIARLFPAA